MGCIYINLDTIARVEFDDLNNQQIVLKNAKIAEARRIECIDDNKNLIFETVFSAFDKIDFLILAQKKGYFIRFFFVGTKHPQINTDRITHRVLKGGHDVPITKIISRYRKSILNCCFISNLVNR